MDQQMTETPLRDCLVAVVNNDRDLKRFAQEGWYRIPARAVGRTLAAEALEESKVLAMYQTAGVRDGIPSAVELWGEIRERMVVPRRVIIPEEPYHPAADEEYHLLRLRNVEHLAAPIISHRPRRVTFIRTTQSRLFHAGDINDLIVGTAAEERLWMSLREGEEEIERKYYMRVHDVVMEVDFALFRQERSLGIICGEERRDGVAEPHDAPVAWSLLRFSPGRLEHDLAQCLGEIAATIAQMRQA